MNVWKKISALTFVLVLALALSVTAFASQNLTDGKVGSGGETMTALSGPINIKKEIVVYNATSHAVADAKVAAPTFSYTYTVTPATVSSYTVNDGTVSVPVQAGLTTNVTVNGGTAGNTSSATGTLAFPTTATYFATSASGATNSYDIPIDFTGVNFTQPGVYRYQIAETLTGDGATYSALSMTDGGLNTLYLDVYVDGNKHIYGYVCMPANSSVAATPTETTKVNGFVTTAQDASDNTKIGADSYYTYDLTLSKTVQNDNYAANNHGFPFTVIFTRGTGLGSSSFSIVETLKEGADTTYTVGFNPPASTAGWSGIVTIKSGDSITYTGIPCGVNVEVYETNDMNGVTYSVTTTANGTAGSAETADYTTTPTSVVPQTSKATYQSTKATFTTTLATAVATAQTYAVTNALINISPTGVTMRYAPYLLTLCAGITVLPLTRSYKRREEE